MEQKIDELVKSYREDMIQSLEELVRIPSVINLENAGEGAPFGQEIRSALDGLMELAKELPGDKKIILGFRDEQYLTEELNAYGDVYVATEDGSAGTKGNVLDAIRENGLRGDVICACGPTPMLRALKEYSIAENIPCYLSLEERMACGIGACLGCVCQSTEVDGHSNVRNKRVCKDGPVFLATEVEL